MGDDAVAWSVAWRHAAYGPDGFYRSEGGHAEDHFVTAVMEAEETAHRVWSIAAESMLELASAGEHITVTDVGAADGVLLRQLRSIWPERLRAVTEWRGIDLRQRPPDLDVDIAWITGDVVDVAPRLGAVPGLVVAHELLDDVPCDVVEPDDGGLLRMILVDPTSGRESIGPVVTGAVQDWCRDWWPRTEPAARIEVGIQRDEAWRAIRSLVTDGLAIAVDYGHVLSERAAGRWDGGTLTAYVDGRAVRAIPDGSRNITAHVALDACAAAAPRAHTSLTHSGAGNDFWWLVQSTMRKVEE